LDRKSINFGEINVCGLSRLNRESGYTSRIITRQITVVIGISLVLFFLGILGLLLLNTKKLIDQVKEEIPFSVYLIDQTTPFEINEIRNNLELDPAIKNLRFVSKEQAAKEFAEVIGEDFIDFLGHNPLQSSFEIQFYSSFVSIDSLEMKKSELLGLFPPVGEIVYNKTVLSILDNNFIKVIFVLALLAGVFLFFTTVMISTTVKLSIYSKRIVIKTMQLVGATKSFIRKPFITRNLWLGLIASLLAIIALVVLIVFLTRSFPGLNLIPNYFEAAILLITLPTISILITGISSLWTTNHYLGIKTEEAYKF